MNNFIISPQDGPSDSSHITCYANRRTGNHIVKATSIGTLGFHNTNMSYILTRGIQNYDWNTTLSNLMWQPHPTYMLFEFPAEVSIRTLIFLIHNNLANLPSDQTEIRVGTTTPVQLPT